MTSSFSVEWRKEKLIGSIDYPENFKPQYTYPLIIICHGFIGTRIGMNRLFVKASQELIQDGNVVIRFDYAGCGESSGNYGDIGLTGLIEQTHAIIQFAMGLTFVDKEQITLLGHSLGGATSVLTAINEKQIKNLILWSAVGQPFNDIEQIISKKKVEQLETRERIEYLGYYFSSPYFETLKRYKPINEIEAFKGDVLLIHGTADDDIPVTYCAAYEQSLMQRGLGTVKRKEIEGADHIYSNGPHFKELIQATRKWLCRGQFEGQIYERKIL
ncbi:alpha/beta hydrolase [Bacillus massilinigeriensis]|uniref:alpha/beta hydrolase n=1 Tax=Bacillus massilionigeriensis TaxID=1805475 RepID=UPI00096B618E|nr:alpha/beta fold hydrolase [Bacillus massilionigeriensis]